MIGGKWNICNPPRRIQRGNTQSGILLKGHIPVSLSICNRTVD